MTSARTIAVMCANDATTLRRGVINNPLLRERAERGIYTPDQVLHTLRLVDRAPGTSKDRPRADLGRGCRVSAGTLLLSPVVCGFCKKILTFFAVCRSAVVRGARLDPVVTFVLTPPLSSYSSSLDSGMNLGQCAPS